VNESEWVYPSGILLPRLESKNTEDFLAASASRPVNLIGMSILPPGLVEQVFLVAHRVNPAVGHDRPLDELAVLR